MFCELCGGEWPRWCTCSKEKDMNEEYIYLHNLIDIHLETADVFIEEKNYQNAAHRLFHAIYEIKQLIKLLSKEENGI